MLRYFLLLCCLVLPASAQQILSTEPAEITTVQGNRPDPSAVPNVPRLLEAQLRDFAWSAELAWSPEPNYGNIYASRFALRSCQPVGPLTVSGKEENTDTTFRISIRSTQLFPVSPVTVVMDGVTATVSQNVHLACYLQVDFGPRSWVLSVPKKVITLRYKVAFPKA